MADATRVERTLAVTRSHFRAPLAARDRVRAGLIASGRLAAGASEVASAGPRGAGAAGVSKSMSAALAGLALVAGYWLGGQRTGEPAPSDASPASLTSAPSASTPATPSELASEAPSAAEQLRVEGSAPPRVGAAAQVDEATQPAASKPPAAKPHEPRASKRSIGTAQPTKRDRSSRDELALLQRAERAIRSGDPDLALAFLDDIERRYPNTRLGEERTAARLMARCARADAGASEEARRFLQSHGASVYTDRVGELCGLALDVGDGDGFGVAGH